MEYIKTEIEGVWIIEPRVFNDQRGYFLSSYKQAEFDEHVGHHDRVYTGTMSRNQAMVFFVDCIIRLVISRRLSL